MKSSRLIIVIALITVVFSFTGCSKKGKLSPEVDAVMAPGSGWLRLGVYGDPLSLNPIAHLESEFGQLVSRFVHAAPLRKLEDGTFVPYLFESYTIYEGSETGELILAGVWRNGLKWHDGSDFDPRALEFTIEQIRRPENKSPLAELAAGVKSIKTLDRGRNTNIVFTHNSRQILDLLTVGILPQHIIKDQPLEEARVEKEGLASESWPLYVDQPVGLGPYQIQARQKGVYLQLQPHPQFFDGVTRAPVLVRTYYDYQQQVTDFRAKKLDWISLPSMVANQLETMKVDSLFFVRYPNPACMTWLFNMKNPILSDRRVRQALDLLADRQKVEKESPFDGMVLFEPPFIASGSRADAGDYNARFAQALNLLDEAGWKDGDGDGIREQNGQKLELRIVFNEDNLLRRAIAEKFAQDCRRAGISLQLHAVTWSDLVAKHLKQGDFDTALVSFKLPQFGNLNRLLHSKARLDLDESGLNYVGLENAQLDATLEKLDSMLEIQDAAALRADLQRFLLEERPMAFLFRPYDVGIIHDASGSARAESSIWNDVYNWKALFGPAESKL